MKKLILLVVVLVGLFGSIVWGANFPPSIVVNGQEFTMPHWVTIHPCPNGHTDLEYVDACLINDTMTVTVHCKTCDMTFYDAFINLQTRQAYELTKAGSYHAEDQVPSDK